MLSLFAGSPEDVDKFLTDVTGLENPLSLRVQHIDLRNEAIKSGKKLKIDLAKFDEYRKGVSVAASTITSNRIPITGSLPVSTSQNGGLAGRTQNKRIHDIGRVKTLKKEKKKKKKKKEKKEKKEKKLKKKKA